MPNAIKTHRPTLHLPKRHATLKERQGARTLSLNGAKWRKLRAMVLAERPLCAHCFERGRIVPATEVDHADEDPSNNERSNLVSLCHACHSTKTMRVRNGSAPVYGCDVNGTSLDPKHAWNENRQQPSGANRARRLADTAAGFTDPPVSRSGDAR